MREVLFIRLVIEYAKWLRLRKDGWAATDRFCSQQRGVIRGMALAMAKMWGNGYEPHWEQEVKDLEECARSLAGKWLEKGQPTKDKFWLRRRHLFWVSSIDQGGARK